jgi:PAS domain S-box-containing protein
MADHFKDLKNPLADLGSCDSDATRTLLAAIVESSEDAIISKNLQGVIQSWNRSAQRIFGYTAEEIVGKSVLKLIPPELQSEEPEILRRISNGLRIEHHETRRLRKDGQLIDVSLTISPIRDCSGTIIGASKIARDITDRKRLDQARFQLAAIVESSGDAIISKDLNSIITTWNRAAGKLFGYSSEEMIGKSVLLLIPPELQYEEEATLRRIRSGLRVEHYETVRVRKGGERIDVSLTISPIRDMVGNVIGVSKIARDISQRKQTERALLESEKFAATGRMAAMIAHEINNPLEAITNLAYLLSINKSLDGDAQKYAQLLLNEISRVSLITRQTLSYYRDIGRPTVVDMRDLLDNVIELHHSKIANKRIRVLRSYRDPVIVRGFASELRQVFVNLVINAIDAVPVDGEIHIRMKQFAVSDNGNSNRALVSVADNGKGIRADVRDRIFEPFFTTKGSTGTGLGLWVSNGIVAKHGGRIVVRSRTTPGRSGTLFAVILPQDDAQDNSLAIQTGT